MYNGKQRYIIYILSFDRQSVLTLPFLRIRAFSSEISQADPQTPCQSRKIPKHCPSPTQPHIEVFAETDFSVSKPLKTKYSLVFLKSASLGMQHRHGSKLIPSITIPPSGNIQHIFVQRFSDTPQFLDKSNSLPCPCAQRHPRWSREKTKTSYA